MSEQFNIDEVSLQCFTNKYVYKRYLASKYPGDATKTSANTETRKKAVLQGEALLDLFTKLLHNTSADKYNILDSKYYPFLEACLDYLEKIERREIANDNSGSFGACNDLPIVNIESSSP